MSKDYVINAHQRNRLEKIWNLNDIDGDGKVLENDFILWGQNVCKLSGLEYTDERKQGWIDAYALYFPGDAGQDMEKWIDSVVEFCKHPNALEMATKQNECLFACADTNNNDVVEIQEFRNFVHALGVEDDLEYSFKIIDANGDGVLQLEEMCEAFARYYIDTDDTVYKHFFGKHED